MIRLAGAGIHNRTHDHQGLLHAERINIGRVNVRDELHIRFCDPLEATDRGAIEQLTMNEEVLIHRLSRKVKVLLHAGHVGKSDIDKDDFFVLNKVENFLGTGKHSECSLGFGLGGGSCEPHATI